MKEIACSIKDIRIENRLSESTCRWKSTAPSTIVTTWCFYIIIFNAVDVVCIQVNDVFLIFKWPPWFDHCLLNAVIWLESCRNCMHWYTSSFNPIIITIHTITNNVRPQQYQHHIKLEFKFNLTITFSIGY